MSLIEDPGTRQRSGDFGLSIREAAERANISERTVWRLVNAGHLRAIKASQRRRIIMDSELSRYLSHGLVA